MKRRTILAAPAALAAAAVASHAGAGQAAGPGASPYAAIRERVALVMETFAKATAGYPEPMTPKEAAAVLAFTDGDCEFPMTGPVALFALR